MTTDRHTPGPWGFSTKPQPNGCPIVGARGLMVAMLAHSINHEDQRETAIANARLIAASPKLLAALRACLDVLEDAECGPGYLRDEAFKLAREVLAEVEAP